MDYGNIYFSKDMKQCLDIIEEAINGISDEKTRDEADYAIKYLKETAAKGVEPTSLYNVKRGCPTAERKIKTGIEIK